MNRNEFMAKVARIMSVADTAQVETSYLLSKKFHKGQLRRELGTDGLPLRYFEHCRRTALILIDEAGVREWELISAALLHDSIEDSDDITIVARVINEMLGGLVTKWVLTLSKFHKESYVDNLRNQLTEENPGYIMVKAADRLDNLRSLPTDDPEFSARQLKETREIYLPLFATAKFRDPLISSAFSRLTHKLSEFCR